MVPVSFIALFFIGGPAIADLGTSDWTPTDGVIIDSGVDSSTDSEGGTTYCLWVDYQYTYDNRTYGAMLLVLAKTTLAHHGLEKQMKNIHQAKK